MFLFLSIAKGQNYLQLGTEELTKGAYSKSDLYLYIDNTYNSGFPVVGGGFLWNFGVKGQTRGDIFNCLNQNLVEQSIYFPFKQWVHLVVVRNYTGYKNICINEKQFIAGKLIRPFPYTYISLRIICWDYYFGGVIVYVDDVKKYYSPIGIKNISYEISEKISLSQNYPNSFNPSTKIKFDLAKSESVTLKIFDALGKEVETLLNEQFAPIAFEVDWNTDSYASAYISTISKPAISLIEKE